MKIVVNGKPIVFELPKGAAKLITTGEHELVETEAGSNKYFPQGHEACVAHYNWWHKNTTLIH